MPIAPISQLVSVTLKDASGAGVQVGGERYRIELDMARPRLVGLGVGLPLIPEGGEVVILFDAGFGATWAAVPADLAQAVLLLAAEFYEKRHDLGTASSALPLSVHALIERWRTVRLLGGAR